ncbi:MAG TPA: hypothetical protein ENH32_00985 [Proteobacteria bacterium]|nr:acyl-CoA dehydrogenase [bacterium BMS3Abin14]HDL52528.1 hypothetical protein [Pseudomonadota bacterium]
MSDRKTGEETENEVRRTGFLEGLYLDGFDETRFKSLVPAGPDQKAVEIIRRYRELIKGHSPAALEKKGKIPDKLWDGLKEIGLFGLNIPEEYGGVGLTLAGYLSVLRDMARTDMALALTPTAHLSIGLKGIILFGSEEQKKKYLTPAASGEMIFAYVLTEPKAGSDAQHIETTAELSGDGTHYILNGQKTYITNGGFAGGLTVFAQMDPEHPGFMGALIVETAWDGVKVGREIPKMGLKISSTTPISFDDVRVPVKNLLGQPGDGFKIAMTILNYGRLGLGAASVGAMEQSVEDMMKRATSRKQFGVPIRDFQLIQEKMVRARVHAFAAASMTASTSRLLEEDPVGGMAMESSHVKLYGTTRAWDTLYDALQTAGGAGYLAVQPYEKRMRDFRVTTVFEGTTEIHSIYPALSLMRALGKRLKESGRGRVGQAFYLLKEGLKCPSLRLRCKNGEMRRAAHTARRNARAVRRMAHLGLLFYGKKITAKEFFLRRITYLSLDCYGLLAMLARIGDDQEKGRDVTESVHRLAYFNGEAMKAGKVNRRLFTRRSERLHRDVYSDLLGAGDMKSEKPDNSPEDGGKE